MNLQKIYQIINSAIVNYINDVYSSNEDNLANLISLFKDIATISSEECDKKIKNFKGEPHYFWMLYHLSHANSNAVEAMLSNNDVKVDQSDMVLIANYSTLYTKTQLSEIIKKYDNDTKIICDL